MRRRAPPPLPFLILLLRAFISERRPFAPSAAGYVYENFKRACLLITASNLEAFFARILVHAQPHETELLKFNPRYFIFAGMKLQPGLVPAGRAS